MHVRVCVDMSVLACTCPPSPVLQAHDTIVGFPGAEVSTTQDLVYSPTWLFTVVMDNCISTVHHEIVAGMHTYVRI